MEFCVAVLFLEPLSCALSARISVVGYVQPSLGCVYEVFQFQIPLTVVVNVSALPCACEHEESIELLAFVIRDGATFLVSSKRLLLWAAIDAVWQHKMGSTCVAQRYVEVSARCC